MSDPDLHPSLAAPRRAQIVRILRHALAPMSVEELAHATGTHPNTCREHLARLIDARLVARTQARSGQRGRPSWRYAATDAGSVGTPGSGALARALVDHIGGLPDAATQAQDAGRRWARHVDGSPRPDTVGRLMALFDDAGFDPVAPDRPGGPVGLRACPFGVRMEDESRLACGVHRGLIQGALEAIGAPPVEVTLEPFVRPDLCLAHIGSVPPVGPVAHG